jgi:uncharacterized protein YjdB
LQEACIGGTTTFTSTITGGVWSSSAPATATIDPATGVITGVATGTATITYTVAGTADCPDATATREVTIVAPPSAGNLNGLQEACIGGTTNFSSSITGGVWSSSAPAIATIDPATGVITGVAAGTAIMTYTVAGNADCPDATATREVTIVTPPSAGNLSGEPEACIGGTTTFSSSILGGTWSSGSPAIATINPATGEITGVAAGTATMTYTVAGNADCPDATATREVTIVIPPSAGNLSGEPEACIGGTTTFFSSITGGVWSSSAPAIATINSTTGAITGVAPGTATMTYTVAGTGGCADATETRDVTVTAAPDAGTLSGTQAICVLGTSTFSSTSLGGTWMSSNPAIATINATTGVISGIAPGTATMTYTVAGTGGCADATETLDVTVTAAPDAGTLSGTQAICVLGTSTFTSTSPGGTWMSSNPAIATINPTTGVVSGIAPGTATMTYTVAGTGGCADATETRIITVNPTPVIPDQTVVAYSEYPFTVSLANGTPTAATIVPANTRYTWTVVDNPDVSGDVAQNTPQTNISQTLVNNTATTQTVTYTVTPVSGAAGACVGDTFEVEVTVNPRPRLTSPTHLEFCSSNSIRFSYVPESSVPVIFRWTRPAVTGITAGATLTPHPENPTNHLLENITAQPVDIVYIYTLNLNGNLYTENVTVTVNPVVAITNRLITTEICSGQTFSVTPVNDINGRVPDGTTYTWTVGNTVTVDGESSEELTPQASISQTLTNPGLDGVTRILNYTVTPWTNGCPGPTFTVRVTVYPAPTVNIPVSTGACSGEDTNPIILTGNNIPGKTYTWTNDNPSIGLAASGTGNIPSFTAINTGSNPVTANITVTPHANGCAGSPITFPITVSALPTITLGADYCDVPGYVKLVASSNIEDTEFSWNTVPVQTGPSIEVDVAGTYIVTATSSSSGCQTTASISVAQELVVNGSFTNGNDGVISDYTYQPDDPDNPGALGNGELYDDSGANGYGVGTSAQNYHIYFRGIDHTNNTVGPRNMMIINGKGPQLRIWEQTVVVEPNTLYYFSAWAMSINIALPYAKLQFEINGEPEGSELQLGTAPTNTTETNANNFWRRFYGTWNSGDVSGQITIRIINLETSQSGNDFALDDISFGTLSTFLLLTSPEGTDDQVVCAGSPIEDISYSAGSGIDGPTVSGLPTGVTSNWNGVTLRFSGTPTVPGTYNYIVTTTGSCAPITKTGTIIVRSNPSPGVIEDSQTICSGERPEAFTSISDGTGAPGSAISYRWESNTNLTTPEWTSIPLETEETYAPPALNTTTQYRRITLASLDGVICESLPELSPTVTVTVALDNTVTTEPSPPPICLDEILTPITHTTTGATGIVPESASVRYNLPNGVTATWAAGIITISGTPTESGVFNYNIPLDGGCGTVSATGTITVSNPMYPITAIDVVNPGATPGVSIFTVYSAELTPGTYTVVYSTSGANQGAVRTITVNVTTAGEFTFTSLPNTREGTTLLTILSIQKSTDLCAYVPPYQNTALYGVGCSEAFLQNDTFYVPANVYEVTIQLFVDGMSNTISTTMPVWPSGVIFAVFDGSDVFATEVPPSEPVDVRKAGAIAIATGNNGRIVFSYDCNPLQDCATTVDNGNQYTDSDGFTVLRFDLTDDCIWQAPDGLTEFEVLVVGGGGGGGFGSAAGGGGGAAVVYQQYMDITMGGEPGLQGATFNISVGARGGAALTPVQAGGTGGSSSFSGPSFSYLNGASFSPLSAAGGGGGGSTSATASIRQGGNGASGGGGAASGSDESAGGVGSPGTSGGAGYGETTGAGGGGGGGAAGAGTAANSAAGTMNGGSGGSGRQYDISGEDVYYGAGGGGTSSGAIINQAGAGGSPYTTNGIDYVAGGGGTNNGLGQPATTYGSGGGAGSTGGSPGFPGVIYIRYPNYSILPVEYLHFDAKYNPTFRSGDLTWTTAKEWENERFDVERSVNTVKDWETIGQVKGAGYSDSPLDYAFQDFNLPLSGGNIFYRLKQRSFNGDSSYSDTKAIRVEPMRGTSYWRIYPNPTTGDPINLELMNSGIYHDEIITVRIIASTGQYDVVESIAGSSLNSLVSDKLRTKAAGVYTIEINWGIYREYHKIILRR